MIKAAKIISIILTLLTYACGSGGGSEAGNAERSVIGSVTSNNPNLAKAMNFSQKAAADFCVADQIIATDSSAQTTNAVLTDNCSFTLALATGQSYSLAILLEGEFIANVLFNNGPNTLNSNFMLVSSGNGDIDLGELSIINLTARPGQEPSRQTDFDDDGIFDFDDEDDNDDGEDDVDEEDCDFDGIFDDFDDIDEGCEDEVDEEGGTPEILEIFPSDDAGIDNNNRIEVDEEISARFDCEIDEDSVDDASFVIESDDHTVTCEYETDDDEIVCEHDDDEFDEDTIYEASIDGIFCENSEEAETLTWRFRTEN